MCGIEVNMKKGPDRDLEIDADDFQRKETAEMDRKREAAGILSMPKGLPEKPPGYRTILT